jgi:beta-galactosidase
VTIPYSTAQLLTRIESGGETTLYFVALSGIPVEFALDSSTIQSLQASSGEQTREAGMTIVTRLKPGAESFLDVTAANGQKTRLVVLTQQEAENAWKVRLGGDSAGIRGSDHLLITAQDFFADSRDQPGRLWLRSRGDSKFEFSITPPPAALQANLPLTKTESNAQIARFTAEGTGRKPELKYSRIQPAGEAPPVAIAPSQSWRPRGVAQAPGGVDPPYAASWSIALPSDPLDGLSELYLDIRYCGDVARLTAGNRLLTDNFYNGQPWSVGLRRFIESKENKFELSILPLRRDAPIYLETPGDL